MVGGACCGFCSAAPRSRTSARLPEKAPMTPTISIMQSATNKNRPATRISPSILPEHPSPCRKHLLSERATWNSCHVRSILPCGDPLKNVPELTYGLRK